jgi:predicted ABC-class ATPase
MPPRTPPTLPTATHHDLERTLRQIDGAGYGRYRALEGAWAFPDFVLVVDRVQRDPFAPPSRVRVFRDAKATGLSPGLCTPGPRAEGLACHLARHFAGQCRARWGGAGPGAAGLAMTAPAQEVLPITAVLTGDDGSIEARFTAGLPARGRRIDGPAAVRLLLEDLPALVAGTFTAGAHDPGELALYAEVNEDALALRAALRGRGLVAFVADGALLPRRSGIDDRPLEGAGVVPFESPPSLRVTLERPNLGPVRGLGIPAGVTLITGGGYHGKSTLLDALGRGVWNHRPGDGREWVVTDPDAVRIRAEDGRSVAGVDVSPFIGALPGEGAPDPAAFSTGNASGSTSQAAATVEALEAGARLLLVDEDTAANNFMVRDRRMQALVPASREPIRPFVDRVRELHDLLGVSTVLVVGGSGDYLDEADLVLALDAFRCHDATEAAREVAAAFPTGRLHEAGVPLAAPTPRHPDPATLDPARGRRRIHLRPRGVRALEFGTGRVELAAVEMLVSEAQLRAAGEALVLVAELLAEGGEGDAPSVAELLDRVEHRLSAAEARGGCALDALGRGTDGDLAGFRRHELAAILNRVRGLRVTPS